MESIIDDCNTIEFGLPNNDLNWLITKFLPHKVIHHANLTPSQIDTYCDLLDWNIMSNRFLKGWVFVKHIDKINIPVFLKNNKPKSLKHLVKIMPMLIKYKSIFDENCIKNMYYCDAFYHTFRAIIDWKWVIVNRPTLYIIKNIRNMVDVNDLIIEYYLPDKIVDELFATGNAYTRKLLIKYQKLNPYLINKMFIDTSESIKYLLIRENYICTKSLEKYFETFNKETRELIIKTIPISYNTIKKHRDIINFHDLLQNQYMNKPDSTKVLFDGHSYFIIAPKEKIKYLNNINFFD